MELTKIPAPPFGEAARADWLQYRFRELELKDVHIDAVGNVLGVLPGEDEADGYVSMSAHIDTVFPIGTPLHVRRDRDRLYGPGISDNAAGVIAMLGVAGALRENRLRPSSPIVFIGNVGEEGEGNLRGVRLTWIGWLNSGIATVALARWQKCWKSALQNVCKNPILIARGRMVSM